MVKIEAGQKVKSGQKLITLSINQLKIIREIAKLPRASLESITGEIISDSSPGGGGIHSSSGTFRVSIKTETRLPISKTWLDSVEDFLMPLLQATLHASFSLPQTNKRSTQKQAYWVFFLLVLLQEFASS